MSGNGRSSGKIYKVLKKVLYKSKVVLIINKGGLNGIVHHKDQASAFV